jgi:hypothetical protein
VFGQSKDVPCLSKPSEVLGSLNSASPLAAAQMMGMGSESMIAAGFQAERGNRIVRGWLFHAAQNAGKILPGY